MPEIQFSALSLVISLIIALAVSYFFYKKLEKKISYIPKVIRRVLIFLRFSGIFLLIWLLFDVYIIYHKSQTRERNYVVLFDASESVKKNIPDLGAVYQNIKNYIENKSENINVKYASFGNGVLYTDSLLKYSFNKTDISGALLTLSELYENDGSNVLMITDGIWNSGSDPLFMNFPGIKSLHLIGIGDSTLYPDATISELRFPSRCSPGETAIGEIQLFFHSMKGKNVTVRISEGKNILFEKNVNVNTDKYSSDLMFEFPVSEKGIHTYKTEIITSFDEKNKINNSRWFSITVEDIRHEILVLYDHLTPDMNAIYTSLSRYDEYKFTLKPIHEGKHDFEKIPSACLIFHPGKYTAELLAFLKNKNIPVWFFNPDLSGLTKNFQIQQLLPDKLTDAEPLLNPSFDYFNLTAEQKDFYSQFPALVAPSGIYTHKSGLTLFQQKINAFSTQLPLWIFDKESTGMRYVWTLGDGLWKWKFYEYRKRNQNDYFNELIYKTMQFLTADPSKKRLNLQYEKIIKEFEDIHFSATYLNENLERDVSGEVRLSLKDSTGKTFEYLMSPYNMNYRLNAGKFPPGKYRVSVQTERNKQIYKDEGTFVVLPAMIELTDLHARFNDLRLLAQKNNGTFHTYNQFKNAIEEWLSDKYQKKIVESEEVMESPVHIKWLFFIILFYFVAEWVILKYFGYI
jgi:predicted membrane protein